MSIYKEKPLDRKGLKTIPLAERPAKVSVSQFARPYAKGEGVMGLVESMPRILAGESFRAVVEAVQRAWDLEKPILWGLGGHVVKVGLGPTLIDLMERGFDERRGFLSLVTRNDMSMPFRVAVSS